MIELRARIGESESELAIKQGCTCKEDKSSCLVHSDIDAYVVEYRFMGRKRMLSHPNSFIHIPIKYEVKFFKTIYEAACEWHKSNNMLETAVYIKNREGGFRSPTKEERVKLMDRINTELAGI